MKADPYSQEFLLRRDCFERTPYIGQHGWTSVRVDRIPDREEIAELARQAYLRAAQRKLAQQLEDTG